MRPSTFPTTPDTAPILANALERIWDEAHKKNCHPTAIVSILEVARRKCIMTRNRRFDAEVEKTAIEMAGDAEGMANNG